MDQQLFIPPTFIWKFENVSANKLLILSHESFPVFLDKNTLRKWKKYFVSKHFVRL